MFALFNRTAAEQARSRTLVSLDYVAQKNPNMDSGHKVVQHCDSLTTCGAVSKYQLLET